MQKWQTETTELYVLTPLEIIYLTMRPEEQCVITTEQERLMYDIQQQIVKPKEMQAKYTLQLSGIEKATVLYLTKDEKNQTIRTKKRVITNQQLQQSKDAALLRLQLHQQ